MKYIAVKANKYEFVTPENEQTLIAEGYVLYTQSEYEAYITAQSEMTDAEILVYLEEVKAEGYMSFGSSLWVKMKKKVWAINTLNKSKGILMTQEEMLNLLSLSNSIESCLKTASYLTARSVLVQMKTALPLYASVGDFAIAEIDAYMEIV